MAGAATDFKRGGGSKCRKRQRAEPQAACGMPARGARKPVEESVHMLQQRGWWQRQREDPGSKGAAYVA